MEFKIPKSDERLKCATFTGFSKANKNQLSSSSGRRINNLSLQFSRRQHEQRKRRYDVDIITCLWDYQQNQCPVCIFLRLQDYFNDSCIYFDGREYYIFLQPLEHLMHRLEHKCYCFHSNCPFISFEDAEARDVKQLRFATKEIKQILNKALKTSRNLTISIRSFEENENLKSVHCSKYLSHCKQNHHFKAVVSLRNLKKVTPAKIIIYTVLACPINDGYPIQATSEPSEESETPSGLVQSVNHLEELSTPENGAENTFETNSHSGGFTRYPPRYPEYQDFVKRFQTFTHWPRQLPEPTQLVDAGFFFTNTLDLVRCFYCGIGLKSFTNSDDPLKEHVKYSLGCPFLEVKLGQTRLEEYKRQLRAQDPEANRQQQLEDFGRNDWQFLNPRHPQYSLQQNRIYSYSNWPSHLSQTPRQLAEAGFFYTGIDDHVRCFACDGGLRRWDPDDDPWIEHCRWFPACPFARQEKGDEYIALVQASTEEDPEFPTLSNQNLDDSLSNELQNLRLTNPEYQSIIDEHRTACVDEMGFKEEDFSFAIQALRQQGSLLPAIEDIIAVIQVNQETQRARKEQETARKPETPESLLEENQRLKTRLVCSKCATNTVNALFLPCTHHRLCYECATGVSVCPFCNSTVRKMVKTYMV